jgi:hypothetical protein
MPEVILGQEFLKCTLRSEVYVELQTQSKGPGDLESTQRSETRPGG